MEIHATLKIPFRKHREDGRLINTSDRVRREKGKYSKAESNENTGRRIDHERSKLPRFIQSRGQAEETS